MAKMNNIDEGLYSIRLVFYFSRHLKFIVKQFYLDDLYSLFLAREVRFNLSRAV